MTDALYSSTLSPEPRALVAARPISLNVLDGPARPGKRRVMLSWSSGKDSAWALHKLRQDPGLEVVGLFSTVNEAAQRVSMHAVRLQLLRAQADAAGLPLTVLPIPSPCPNAVYESTMSGFVCAAVSRGVELLAFGDLFLSDIRAYRESRLRGSGVSPLFPVWLPDLYPQLELATSLQPPHVRTTAALAGPSPPDPLSKDSPQSAEAARWRAASRAFADTLLSAGVRAVLTCVDPRQVPGSMAGRVWDSALVAELERLGADPCGERGEFHSFVVAGPMLSTALHVRVGQRLERDGFVFADLTLAAAAEESDESASQPSPSARDR